MSWSRFLFHSLRYHWRMHSCVVLAVMLASLILVGALGVGDSVRLTLQTFAKQRSGSADYLLFRANRFFSDRMPEALEIEGITSTNLFLSGSVSLPDGSARANVCQVLGVDSAFFTFFDEESEESEFAAINQSLARRLKIKVGDEIILRMERPSFISRDAPLSGGRDVVESLRIQVKEIFSNKQGGRFSIHASHLSPYTLYLPIDSLQKKLELEQKANLLLITSQDQAEELNNKLSSKITIEDLGIKLTKLTEGNQWQLSSEQVFLDENAANHLLANDSSRYGVLTYLVNEIQKDADSATPYSMVTAVDLADYPLSENEATISQWLADDLDVILGDELSLRYYVEGKDGKITEDERRFKVKYILPLESDLLRPDWTPDFPGIAEEDNCREWDPGVPIDLEKIRDKDEDYWDAFKGTPKAFISLAAGQEMWGSRYGSLTAVRFALKNSSQSAETMIAQEIISVEHGFKIEAFAKQAKKAAKSPFDFSELFISFSFFIIIAALVNTGLFFAFSLQQRQSEAGLLKALGWGRGSILKFYLSEGFILSVIGSLIGAALGCVYTWLMLSGLETMWRDAVGEVEFIFTVSPLSLLVGIISSIMTGVSCMMFVARNHLTENARDLMSGVAGRFVVHQTNAGAFQRGWRSFWYTVSIIAIADGLGLALLGRGMSGMAASGAFFGAGALFLTGGLVLFREQLLATSRSHTLSLFKDLIDKNLSRRMGRSLSLAGILACGVFLVVAVSVFRKDANTQSHQRSAATGGFALVADTTVPLQNDVIPTLSDVKPFPVVPLRVLDGDEASCLNLNTAQQPRLLGVQTQALLDREAFSFVQVVEGEKKDGWKLLDKKLSERIVPAVADMNSLMWSLGMKVGDDLEYLDDKGELFKIRLVGAVAGTMLQGSLIISEDHFRHYFPNQAGYRKFFIDATEDASTQLAKSLSRSFSDYGMEVQQAADVVNRLNAVENTYIAMFQALGGLGLILGCFGVAVTMLRNVVERRSELALLRSLGFDQQHVQELIFKECFKLVMWGCGLGLGASLLAAGPALLEQFSWMQLAQIMGFPLLLFILGYFLSLFAARFALSQAGIERLRYE
ncbi:MAG: ABC transporter permease [Verrucomicrobiota bacterium]